MRYRTVKWKMIDGNVDVKKVGLYKGQTICPACESIVGSDGNKLDGPGCTKCDPDKAISPFVQRDLISEDKIEDEAVMKFFFNEAVDPVEAKDMDVVMHCDITTKEKIGRMLVMDDEDVDPFDEILARYDSIHLRTETDIRDEIEEELAECDRQIEHHELALMLEPIKPEDVYKSVRLPVAV